MTIHLFMDIRIYVEGDEYLVVSDYGDEGLLVFGSGESARKGEYGIHVSLNIDGLEEAVRRVIRDRPDHVVAVPDTDGEEYLFVKDFDEGVFISSTPDMKNALHVELAVDKFFDALRRITAYQEGS